MDFSNKINWEQGLFLQPQHLQLSDLNSEYMMNRLFSLFNDNLWGCNNLQIDELFLKEDTIAVKSGVFIFKDGSFTEIGVNAKINTRSFSNEWSDRTKPLDVYIALKKIDHNGSNTTLVKKDFDLKDIKTRYIASEQPSKVKDIYGSGPEAYVKTNNYYLNIIFGDEVIDSSDYEVIKVARLLQDGNKIKLDEEYIEPSLSIKGSKKLYSIIKTIRDSVHARSKQLEVYKGQTNLNDISLEKRRWVNLSVLRIFNRYVSILSNSLEESSKSVNDMFSILLQLISELSTFISSDIDTELDLGSANILSYDHNELFYCFNSLKNLIFKLCDNITLVPSQFYRLDNVNGVFSANIPESAFNTKMVYYIRFRSISDDINEVVDTDLKSSMKIGAITNINVVVDHALSGVEFDVLEDSPVGVPIESECIYIKLNSINNAWRDVVSSHSIALICNDIPDDIEVNLICSEVAK